MKILAAIPDYQEAAETRERAAASLRESGLDCVFYPGGVRGPTEEGFAGDTGVFASQAQMRQHGFALACQHGADWVLQMDADERLIHGHLLAPILARTARAYPIPIVQENGDMTLAPFKCLQARPLEFVASCDQIRWPDQPETVWCLSGYPAPEPLRLVLLGLPHLLHEPSLRPGRRRSVRLPEVERTPDAVPWPLPVLTLSKRSHSHV